MVLNWNMKLKESMDDCYSAVSYDICEVNVITGWDPFSQGHDLMGSLTFACIFFQRTFWRIILQFVDLRTFTSTYHLLLFQRADFAVRVQKEYNNV